MTLHLVRMTAITASIVFCTFYPYFPGEFDGLAVALSTMAHIVGLLGVAVAAVGLIWLTYEVRKRAARRRHLTIQCAKLPLRARFAIAGSVVAAGAYNLLFELPVFLVVSPGTQEIVMYNQLDDHVMLSHASWNVTRSPEGLRNGRAGMRFATHPVRTGSASRLIEIKHCVLPRRVESPQRLLRTP